MVDAVLNWYSGCCQNFECLSDNTEINTKAIDDKIKVMIARKVG